MLQGSVDLSSQHMGGGHGESSKPGLTRSQTDSNIVYSDDGIHEAPGSTFYITKDGDIDLQVIVKVSSIYSYKNW